MKWRGVLISRIGGLVLLVCFTYFAKNYLLYMHILGKLIDPTRIHKAHN